MKYPDGSHVHVGDLIWWNEGNCVGYVQSVAESQTDYETWGLDEPGIFVSNYHPFDRSNPSGVFYPTDSFEDEGIGTLTLEEQKEFERAKRLALTGRPHSWFSVTTDVEDNVLKSWIFTLLDEQDRKHVVAIPYETPS